MPKEKVETILLYNEQDVVNLYNIYVSWKNFVNGEEKEISDEVLNKLDLDLTKDNSKIKEQNDEIEI